MATKIHRVPESAYAEIAKLVNYDPETGDIVWDVDVGRRAKAGAPAGCIHTTGYLRVGHNGKTIFLHRLAFFIMHGTLPSRVDHINGNRSDNRAENIRGCTNSENMCNRNGLSSNNTSGTAGVSWCKVSNKWVAQIMLRGKQMALGKFTQKADAIAVRRAAELKYFGEFAPNKGDQ